MEIIIAIVALIVGAVIGFLIASVRAGKYKTKIGVLESRLVDMQSSADALVRHERESFAAILESKEKAYAESLTRQEKHEKEALDALQVRFDETVAKMKAEVENTTAGLLSRRQSEFAETSRESVNKILEPLNRSIQLMREAVNENTLRHTEIGGQLSNNIKLVMEHSDAARQSAERLADALRGGGKIQGDWGETVLTELLESQGLSEGVHFDTQVTLSDEKGNALRSSDTNRMMRPDVILHLDNVRDVIIDAKVSLSAFLDYANAETDETRATALRNHVASIENHVKELAKKDYSSYVLPPKARMNYVIMFVPSTTALYAATSQKPDLWRHAMEQGVYIADEQTLYAALRIIDMTWRQIAQAENHEKVYALANEMLDRVGSFMDKFVSVGTKLDDARKNYDDAFAKLRDSGQSIPGTCRKLVNLGAKARKQPKGVAPDLLGLSDPVVIE